MAFLKSAILLIPVIAALAAGCMAFLLTVGALTSRKEEEQWSRFWHDTPSTETRRDEPDAGASEEVVLRKAA